MLAVHKEKRQTTFVTTFIAPEMRRKGTIACKCDSCTKGVVSLVHCSFFSTAREIRMCNVIPSNAESWARLCQKEVTCGPMVFKMTKLLNNSGWQGLLQLNWSNALLKAGSTLKLGQVTQDLSSRVLKVSRHGYPTSSQGDPFQCPITTTTMKTVLLRSIWNTLLLPLLLQCTFENRLATSFLQPPH